MTKNAEIRSISERSFPVPIRLKDLAMAFVTSNDFRSRPDIVKDSKFLDQARDDCYVCLLGDKKAVLTVAPIDHPAAERLIEMSSEKMESGMQHTRGGLIYNCQYDGLNMSTLLGYAWKTVRHPPELRVDYPYSYSQMGRVRKEYMTAARDELSKHVIMHAMRIEQDGRWLITSSLDPVQVHPLHSAE